jgi:acetyl-CoA C-acetyltransferase/acetyl-CoA acyltransferase
VVAEAGKVKDLAKKPIWVAGMGQASRGGMYLQKDLTVVQARVASSGQAYKQAGLTPAEVDVVELHDCFTIAEILALEALGFYDFGQAHPAAAKGETALGGEKVTVNTSGGLKAKGHPIGATGAGQIYEIVKQLRGECGDRQVPGAKVGLVDTLGGDLGTNCNVILRS